MNHTDVPLRLEDMAGGERNPDGEQKPAVFDADVRS